MEISQSRATVSSKQPRFGILHRLNRPQLPCVLGTLRYRVTVNLLLSLLLPTIFNFLRKPVAITDFLGRPDFHINICAYESSLISLV